MVGFGVDLSRGRSQTLGLNLGRLLVLLLYLVGWSVLGKKAMAGVEN